MVRIGYDASSTVGRRTGIGIATAQLLSAMTESLPQGWSLRTLVNSGKEALPADDAWVKASNNSIAHTKIPGRLLLRAWQHLGMPAIERLMGDVDLVHSPASYVPPVKRAKRVVTVHDLFFLRAREYDGPAEAEDAFGGAYFRETFPKLLPKADAIIAVSQHTKDDIVRHYKIAPEKITVIHHGVDHKLFHSASTEEDESTVAVWTKGRPYLLCVSSSGPSKRKNLGALLEAYYMARRQMREMPRLVIAGHNASPEAEKEFWNKLNEMGLRRYVIVTGYLKPDTLASFYRRAMALVVPSLSEGFGLPAIEAMACGCPVLASDSGALPEVTGNAALQLNIKSTKMMSEALLRIFESDSLREQLRADGLARARQFTWENAAIKTLHLYSQILGVEL